MRDLPKETLVEVLARAFLGSPFQTSREWAARLDLPDDIADAISFEIDRHLVAKHRSGQTLQPLSMTPAAHPTLSAGDEEAELPEQVKLRPAQRWGRTPKELSSKETEYVIRRRSDDGGWEAIADEINEMRGISEMRDDIAKEKMVSSGSLRRMDNEGWFAKTAHYKNTAESNALDIMDFVTVAPNPSLVLGDAPVEALKILAQARSPVAITELYAKLYEKKVVRLARTVQGQVAQVIHAYAPLKRRGWADRAGPGSILLTITDAGRKIANETGSGASSETSH